ncbi:hypothetical protein, partial [Neoaquamicrobium sediminum]|uniref:hypothetical protein n=1 Tax=Neoaquamicrobium sediminum TaxID=1849104 RepID=UPI003606D6AA
RTSHGRVTQKKRPPANPGRFRLFRPTPVFARQYSIPSHVMQRRTIAHINYDTLTGIKEIARRLGLSNQH